MQNVKYPTKSSPEVLCYQLSVYPSILIYVGISHTQH